MKKGLLIFFILANLIFALEENNIDLMFETEVKDLIIEENEAKGIIAHNVKTNEEEKIY